MSRLSRLLAPTTVARAHCDLPCGIYDPEQARIEAESCLRIIEKYATNDDPAYRTRALAIKEERAELVKHHLDVLWHDYFKPEHLEAVPNLHELFWSAAKAASKVKASVDPEDGKKLLAAIDGIDAAWKKTGGLEKTRVARAARLIDATPRVSDSRPRQPAGPRRAGSWFVLARGGPWRVAVEEASMLPTLSPGDWLLIDPTTRRWPRRGSIVVVREPHSGALAVKRLAAGPGSRVPFADGVLHLAEDEAWLLSDASEEITAAAGSGEPVDSRRYGPVPLDGLVGRAWFRYGPLRRLGRLR